MSRQKTLRYKKNGSQCCYGNISVKGDTKVAPKTRQTMGNLGPIQYIGKYLHFRSKPLMNL